MLHYVYADCQRRTSYRELLRTLLAAVVKKSAPNWQFAACALLHIVVFICIRKCCDIMSQLITGPMGIT